MLFIHDHTFVKKDNHYYTTGSLNQKIMDRYKSWFNGKVTVCANYKNNGENLDNYIDEKNEVKGIDFKLIHKSKNLTNLIKAAKLIKNEVKKNECIVIRMSIFGAIGAYYAKKYKKKYLIEMVACPWDSLWYHSIKGKVLAPFMTFITKIVCKEAPYVLYVTDEFLQRRYPTNGKSIGCSDVELQKLDYECYNNKVNKLKCHNQNIIKMCTIANIEVKYKGQSMVIECLNKLNSNSNIKYKYYLIGGGNPDRLKKIARKCKVEQYVEFLGSRQHDEIFQLIDDMDIYVQPSFQEGLPRAVIEAMSRASVIIGSNAGGIPELINKECIFKKGNKEEFESILKNMTINKQIKLSKENFENSQKYNKEILDKKREEFYISFFYNER